MEDNNLTWWAWAKWWLGAYDRQTEGFTLPLDGLTDEELRRMWYVTDWWIKCAPSLMNNILHPKHKPELRKAIVYLTDLHERQTEAWARRPQTH